MLALLGALAWFVVIKPVREFVAGLSPQQTQSQAQTATPPADTAPSAAALPLTKTDVQKFVRIRRDVRDALGQSFTGLQDVWSQVEAGQTPNLLQVVNVLRQAGSSIGQARAAQNAGLARENMTVQRYTEVRAGVNRALGVPDIDFAQAAQAIQNGQLPNLDSTVTAASTRDKELVSPFKKELEVTAAVGLLGL